MFFELVEATQNISWVVKCDVCRGVNLNLHVLTKHERTLAPKIPETHVEMHQRRRKPRVMRTIGDEMVYTAVSHEVFHPSRF